MARARRNPFQDRLRKLPHHALIRRNVPFEPADLKEIEAVGIQIAAGADFIYFAGSRGDEVGCLVSCFDTEAKAREMQAWIAASGIASRPSP